MKEVKIFDAIVVDAPKDVEWAVQSLTGKAIEFELIRKFILNEKHTLFYLDRKMNSSTNPGSFTDYVWLDTGLRSTQDEPVMICLHHILDKYVGHYTGTMKELYMRIKSSNRKNAKDIEKNYKRFVNKYRNKILERKTICVCDPGDYAVKSANYDVCDDLETTFAQAMKSAGIQIENMVEVPEIEEVLIDHDEFSETEKQITMELLLEQMDSMQNYIDELLGRIESHEKTSQEEIERLQAQNQAYKKALVNIRLFNDAHTPEEAPVQESALKGHHLLGKNEKILVLGNADLRVAQMRAIARDYYGFEKTDFEFMTDYEKVKSASKRIHRSDRFVAVIFGNCPHKVSELGKFSTIIDEFKQRDDCLISIDARNKSGNLKITKQSFQSALMKVYEELKNVQVA